MSEMTFDFPPAIQQWIEQRLAEGRYADAADYVRDLVRRDLERHLAGERPNTAWLRERIAEAKTSPLLDDKPGDIIEQIIAEYPAKECAD